MATCGHGVTRLACACVTLEMVYASAQVSVLRNLDSLQRRHYQVHLAFAPALPPDLPGIPGVTVLLEHADSTMWRARATHAEGPSVCMAHGRVPGPAGSALSVECDPEPVALRSRRATAGKLSLAASAMFWILGVRALRRSARRADRRESAMPDDRWKNQ
jgi:hypothetical protein